MYSLLQELARRDGLHIALSGLTEDELYPLLLFLSRSLAQPRFTPLLLDVCNIVTGLLRIILCTCCRSPSHPSDIYGCMLSRSKTTMALFKVLRVKIAREIQFQKHAFQLLGSINTLLTASSTRPNLIHNHDYLKNIT